MAGALFVIFVTVTSLCAADRGYLLTVPQRLQLNRETRMCMSYWGITNRVSLVLSLNCSSRSYSHQDVHEAGDSVCSMVDVPKYLGVGLCELKIEGVVENSNYNFTASHSVKVIDTSVFTIIQTDKRMYKPGETVKFRILVLTEKLMPGTEKLRSLVIENPNTVRMLQWRNMGTRQGIKSGTFKLSDNPVMGNWKIIVTLGRRRKTIQQFEVKKYVLPKYEILIKPPNYVTVETRTIMVEICARYTYGKPVKGQLRARVCIRPPESMAEYNWRRPCVGIKTKIVGCRSFSINADEMGLKSRNYTLFYDSLLHVTATVMENATGVERTETHQGPKITREGVKIDIATFTRNYFKPYLPFEVKVQLTYPDNTPVTGESVVIKIADLNQLLTYQTDNEGFVAFTIMNITQHTQAFRIQAYTTDNYEYSMTDYTLLDSTKRMRVAQWYSPSHSYLQIQPIRGEIRCGARITLDLLYTYTKEFRPAIIIYQLVSRGQILDSGEVNLDEQFVEDWFNVSDNILDVSQMFAGPGVNEDGTNSTETDGTSQTVSDSDTDNSDWIKIFVGYAKFEMEVTADMIPVSRIVVYYFHSSGEVVSDSNSFTLDNCFRNRATLQFDREEIAPGQQTDIVVSTSPGSLCAIGVVDKKVELFGSRHHLSSGSILEHLQSYDITDGYTSISDFLHCKDREDVEVEEPPIPAMLVPPGPPGLPGPPGSEANPTGVKQAASYLEYYGSRKFVDAILAFKSAGLAVLTNLQLETRPCGSANRPLISGQARGVEGLPGPGGFSSDWDDVDDEVDLGIGTVLGSKPQNIRQYFPETWIWTEAVADYTGSVHLRDQIPDTITEWVGHSFCLSKELGLGISHEADVRSFQPCFLSLNLPYSAVRGEQLLLSISIFNYLSQCLVIDIKLHESSDYLLIHSPKNVSLCVCGGDSGLHHIKIEPSSLGTINITVTGEAYRSLDGCETLESEKGHFHATDTVIRQLIVEAEGVEKQQTFTSYFCLDESPDSVYEETFDLSWDDHLMVVSGSAHGHVSIIGDIMGPALSGLDSLIQLPTGCGEQNMLKFSPTIFVLEYLYNTVQLSEDIRRQATDHLKQGYQNELMFQHSDGSYSTFGVSDKTGSTWLTAFILKSFHRAKDWIYIDNKNLQSSRQWLLSKQLQDGSFEQVGKLLSKYMQGGLSNVDKNTTSLTAFVLVALLESRTDQQDSAVEKAVFWLKSQKIDDTYTLAVTAYALTLYRADRTFRDRLIQQLQERAIVEGDMQHWRRSDINAEETNNKHIVSAEVEITAYTLLALLSDRRPENFDTVLPIVRWLTKQRNSLGGFVSTQDTVVALQALAKFAELVYRRGLDVTVNIEVNEGPVGPFSVTTANSLLLQSADLLGVPTPMHVTAEGSGCVFMQASLKYNVFTIHQLDLPEFFSLSVTPVLTKQKEKNCQGRTIGICTSYTGPGEISNMAIVDVKMVTGWSVDESSLDKLLGGKKIRWLKKYEIDRERGYIHIYFEHLDPRQVCFHFDISQDAVVDNVKPGLAKVYDYYEAGYFVTTTYELPPCGTKNKQKKKLEEKAIPAASLVRKTNVTSLEDLEKELILEKGIFQKVIKRGRK